MIGETFAIPNEDVSFQISQTTMDHLYKTSFPPTMASSKKIRLNVKTNVKYPFRIKQPLSSPNSKWNWVRRWGAYCWGQISPRPNHMMQFERAKAQTPDLVEASQGPSNSSL